MKISIVRLLCCSLSPTVFSMNLIAESHCCLSWTERSSRVFIWITRYTKTPNAASHSNTLQKNHNTLRANHDFHFCSLKEKLAEFCSCRKRWLLHGNIWQITWHGSKKKLTRLSSAFSSHLWFCMLSSRTAVLSSLKMSSLCFLAVGSPARSLVNSSCKVDQPIYNQCKNYDKNVIYRRSINNQSTEIKWHNNINRGHYLMHLSKIKHKRQNYFAAKHQLSRNNHKVNIKTKKEDKQNNF